MKKSILLAVALWAPVAAVGMVPIPHPNQTRKQFTAGKTIGTAFGSIGTLAELNALAAESQLKKIERNLVRLNSLYERSQGTKKEMSAKRYERNKKKYTRQRERLLKELRNSERTAHVGLMGQELAAVRNNWAERPLGAVAQGLAWNAPHTSQTLGRFLPLRTLLVLLDGVLSITRHFWYQSPQHLAWLTAVQRTSRLMKMVLRNGFKGVPKRVLVSYALQLIGVGMSFVGNVRHNIFGCMQGNGDIVDDDGVVVFKSNGQFTGEGNQHLLAQMRGLFGRPTMPQVYQGDHWQKTFSLHFAQEEIHKGTLCVCTLEWKAGDRVKFKACGHPAHAHCYDRFSHKCMVCNTVGDYNELIITQDMLDAQDNGEETDLPVSESAQLIRQAQEYLSKHPDACCSGCGQQYVDGGNLYSLPCGHICHVRQIKLAPGESIEMDDRCYSITYLMPNRIPITDLPSNKFCKPNVEDGMVSCPTCHQQHSQTAVAIFGHPGANARQRDA